MMDVTGFRLEDAEFLLKQEGVKKIVTVRSAAPFTKSNTGEAGKSKVTRVIRQKALTSEDTVELVVSDF